MSSSYSKWVDYVDDVYEGSVQRRGRIWIHHTSDTVSWVTERADGSEPRSYVFGNEEFAALEAALDSLVALGETRPPPRLRRISPVHTVGLSGTGLDAARRPVTCALSVARPVPDILHPLDTVYRHDVSDDIEHKDFETREDAIRYALKTGKAVVGRVRIQTPVDRPIPLGAPIHEWRPWWRRVLDRLRSRAPKGET